jgi:hypothetical protein
VVCCFVCSGKCECALFGGYVDELKKRMGKSSTGLPIVVVQFAKIKIFRGDLLVVVSFYIVFLLLWFCGLVLICELVCLMCR